MWNHIRFIFCVDFVFLRFNEKFEWSTTTTGTATATTTPITNTMATNMTIASIVVWWTMNIYRWWSWSHISGRWWWWSAIGRQIFLSVGKRQPTPTEFQCRPTTTHFAWFSFIERFLWSCGRTHTHTIICKIVSDHNSLWSCRAASCRCLSCLCCSLLGRISLNFTTNQNVNYYEMALGALHSIREAHNDRRIVEYNISFVLFRADVSRCAVVVWVRVVAGSGNKNNTWQYRNHLVEVYCHSFFLSHFFFFGRSLLKRIVHTLFELNQFFSLSPFINKKGHLMLCSRIIPSPYTCVDSPFRKSNVFIFRACDCCCYGIAADSVHTVQHSTWATAHRVPQTRFDLSCVACILLDNTVRLATATAPRQQQKN